jgi:hypothetical protein
MLRSNPASVVVLLAGLLVAGCSDDPVKPTSTDGSIPSRTVGQLLSSPTSLAFDGTPVSLGTWLGRVPGTSSAPEGTPLAAAAYFDPTSQVPLPSFSHVYLWVIRDKADVWATEMSYFDPTPNGGYSYEAADGPRWNIGSHADAVIGVRAGSGPVRYVLVRDLPIIPIE